MKLLSDRGQVSCSANVAAELNANMKATKEEKESLAPLLTDVTLCV